MDHHRRTRAGSARTLHADVVVVGARCAGSATAMLLAGAGHDVLVVDRAEFPSDTVSTHAIARTGMVQLHRWGLLEDVPASGAPRIVRSRSPPPGEPVGTVKDRYGIDPCSPPGGSPSTASRSGLPLGPAPARDGCRRHRRALDPAGRVVGLVWPTRGRRARSNARHVVGADGLESRVARAVAHRDRGAGGTGAVAVRLLRGRLVPAIEYHVADGALAGIFPTHGGEACVWVCAPEAVVRPATGGGRRATGTRLCRLVAELPPALGGAAAPTRGEPHRCAGCCGMPEPLPAGGRAGLGLVGDAGYHRDAVTGHGISDAFRDAELLADALDRGLRDRAPRPPRSVPTRAKRDRMARRDLRPHLRPRHLSRRPTASSPCSAGWRPPSTSAPPSSRRGRHPSAARRRVTHRPPPEDPPGRPGTTARTTAPPPRRTPP